MNLADARSLVIQTLARMKSLYGRPVFNEWILVKLASEQGAILAYEGPRAETYQRQFKTDIGPLRQEIEQRHLAVGDFEFAQVSPGTRYDACVRLGTAAYLFCNHTDMSMLEIRQERGWLDAQKPFAEMAARFKTDPLE